MLWGRKKCNNSGGLQCWLLVWSDDCVFSPCGQAQRSPPPHHLSQQVGQAPEPGCPLCYQSWRWGWLCPLKRDCWALWGLRQRVWETLRRRPHHPAIRCCSWVRTHPPTASRPAAQLVWTTGLRTGLLLPLVCLHLMQRLGIGVTGRTLGQELNSIKEVTEGTINKYSQDTLNLHS